MANVVIIGAGAAGLFAAGTALSHSHAVTVIEHKPTPGNKLLLTAKGRCNLTNNCTVDEFLQNVRSNPRFLYSCLHACSPSFVMQMFEEELNVPLKTERGRRVFPQSDSAQDVLNALIKRAKGANFLYDTKVKALCEQDGKVAGVLLNNGSVINADAVIVATGGVSYAVTGSTGDGYAIAKSVGHTVVKPEPSLVSLVENGRTCSKMTGLSLKNIVLTLWENDKNIFEQQGEMMFTHFGVSGPLVLSASAHIKDFNKYKYRITIDTKPALSAEKLQKRIIEDFVQISNREASNCLAKLLPLSMRSVVLDVWGIDIKKRVNQITREERAELGEILKAFEVKIKSKGDLEHAVITSGGVSTAQIDPKTMQSKLCKGLYFAGEVIDVDAYTGGYNLGIAFATAHAAASYIQ